MQRGYIGGGLRWEMPPHPDLEVSRQPRRWRLLWAGGALNHRAGVAAANPLGGLGLLGFMGVRWTGEGLDAASPGKEGGGPGRVRRWSGPTATPWGGGGDRGTMVCWVGDVTAPLISQRTLWAISWGETFCFCVRGAAAGATGDREGVSD